MCVLALYITIVGKVQKEMEMHISFKTSFCKMDWPCSFILCSALLICTIYVSTVATVASENYHGVYFVQANDKSLPCPVDIEPEYCRTLNFYTQNGSFQSNRTFIFMSGTHKLSHEVIVNGVQGLSLIGNGSVQIVCTNYSAGFAFFDATDLQMRCLNIHKCGIHKNEYSPLAGTVIIKNSLNASLDSLVITNTSGYGLLTINTRGVLSITNSSFAYNKYNSHFEGGNTKIVFSDCDTFVYARFVYIKNTQFLFGSEYYRELESVGCGGLTLVMGCFNVKVYIEDSVSSYNHGFFGANIYIIFQVLTNNSVCMSNVTSSYGAADRGASLYIELVDGIGVNDPYSCDRQKWSAKENLLINITSLRIKNNQGLGAFNIEDRTYRRTDCVTQYAIIKDSSFFDNDSGATYLAGTAVRFGYVPLTNMYNQFNLIATTFENCSFQKNTGHTYSSTLVREPSVLYFEMVKNVTLVNCSVGNNSITGIQAYSSNIHFKGNTAIFGNFAAYGAGLLLMQNSFMFLSPGTHIHFFNNSAKHVGGAIVSDFDLQVPTVCPCFFQLDHSDDINNYNSNSIKVTFHNNTAGLAGSAIFGGRVNECLSYRGSGNIHLQEMFIVNNTEADPSAVTSDPYFVCFCPTDSNLPNCSLYNHSVEVFPGDIFHVSMATVSGNRDGTITGVVHSKFLKSYPNTSFATLQAAQNSNKLFCSVLNYTVYSTQKMVKFTVSTDKVSYLGVGRKESHIVQVTLLDCPAGFELDYSNRKCDCEKHLQNKGIHCDITTQTILPPLGSWVGYYNSSTPNNNISGAIFHRYCPYDYCISKQKHVCLNDTNSQCSSERSGILCGQCRSGLSLTLGRNQCAQCNDVYLLLTLVFALAGVVLVVILFCLRLTVSEGSVNGLIFYVNVVKMNQALLFPTNETNFLSVFISWMNLDVGIDLCFFNGMDGFAKTFLQFVFPAYIWFLVGVVIYLANRFQFIANLIGQRAVQVLATLLLLSYTKLQRVIVTILTYTNVEYPDSSMNYVWLYDGNIGYLKGSHILLFVAAIVCFALLVLPYTILLTFFKLFQAHSDKKAMSWINKLKPVIDAYAGPYKDKFRFWTGFLLLSRTVLIITLSLNWTASPDYNLITSALMSVTLLLISSSVGGIYKNWAYNVLESMSYFNIAAVSMVLLYSKQSQYAVLNCSIGISFLLFVLVVFLHLIKYTCFSVIIARIRHRCCGNVNRQLQEEEELLFDRESSDEEIEQYS